MQITVQSFNTILESKPPMNNRNFKSAYPENAKKMIRRSYGGNHYDEYCNKIVRNGLDKFQKIVDLTSEYSQEEILSLMKKLGIRTCYPCEYEIKYNNLNGTMSVINKSMTDDVLEIYYNGDVRHSKNLKSLNLDKKCIEDFYKKWKV